MIRCDACGAANPERAGWCGQCYATFPEPPAAATAVPATAARTETVAGSDPAVGADPAGGSDHHLGAPRGGFRATGGIVEWACGTCQTWNGINDSACTVCGSRLADRDGVAATAPADGNWARALALSAMAPGAGHLLVRRQGSGVARLLLFTVWLAGGALVASAGTGAVLAAAPLLLGAVAVWAGSLWDLTRLRAGEPELLTGRALLWLVVGVTMLSLLGILGAAGGRGLPAGAGL